MESHLENTGAVVIVIVNDMVTSATMKRNPTMARTTSMARTTRLALDGRNGTNEYRLLESPSHFVNFFASQSIFFDISRTDISECRSRDGRRSQHTRIFFSLRAVWHSSSMCSRFIQCTCIGTRLDGSSQHVCRVFKTVRLLHSHSSFSCLVATSWACLSVVLLFLTDWRRDRGSLASIPAAPAGLVEWLNSHRSQLVLNKRELPISKDCGFPYRVQSVRLLLGIFPGCVPSGVEN